MNVRGHGLTKPRVDNNRPFLLKNTCFKIMIIHIESLSSESFIIRAYETSDSPFFVRCFMREINYSSLCITSWTINGIVTTSRQGRAWLYEQHGMGKNTF